MTFALTVLYSPAARMVLERTFDVAPGMTASDALAASGLASAHPDIDWKAMTPGIWGRAIAWERVLADGDRLELCRPLLVDPKVARRERFQRQGARATGLFARRREGGKAGY